MMENKENSNKGAASNTIFAQGLVPKKTEEEREKEKKLVESKALELLYKKYVDEPLLLFSNPKFVVDTIEKKEEVLRVIVWRGWFGDKHRNKYRRKAREALELSDDDDDGELKCCFFNDGETLCEKQKKEGDKVTYTLKELKNIVPANKVPVGSEMAGKNCCAKCKDVLNAKGGKCALADTGFCAKAEKAKEGGKEPVYYFRLRVPEWYQKALNEETRKWCCDNCYSNLRFLCVFHWDKIFQWDETCQTKRYSKKRKTGTEKLYSTIAKAQKIVPANKKCAGAPCCEACFKRNNFS